MMRKLLIVVAALALPAMVMAQGVVTAPNVSLDLAAGPQTIEITLTGPVGIPGLNLNLQIGDGAFPAYVEGPKIVSADITGAGTALNGANNGPVLMPITEQMYYAGTVTPNAGQKVNIGAGQTVVLGKVVIDPAGGVVGKTYAFSLTSLNGPTDYADDQGILFPTLVDGSITITPEPTTALLLLGALPLLRRRH